VNADLVAVLSRYGITPLGLVHIGANDGQELDAYVEAGFTSFKMFEPLREPFARLKARLAKLPEGVTAIPHNVALGASDGEAEMFVADNQAASSSLLAPMQGRKVWRKIRFVGRETVAVRTLDSFLVAGEAFNVMVLDVQGFEIEVLKGGPETLRRMDCIVCELNREKTYEDSAGVGDVDAFLDAAGFRRMETYWVSRYWGDGVYLRKERVPAGMEPVEVDQKRTRGPIKRWFYRMMGRV
jgi:FkbM family methyltransferase